MNSNVMDTPEVPLVLCTHVLTFLEANLVLCVIANTIFEHLFTFVYSCFISS